MHIFKNGGSTIDSILEREFHDFFATLHGSTPESILTDSQLTSLLEQNPATEVISSHHLRYPKPTSEGYRFLDICMLRHPLDRLFSMYRYLRDKHPQEHSLRDLARSLDCGPFFRACLKDYKGWLENVQVGFLAGPTFAGDRPSALAAALARIKEIDLIGTTELFDESLVTWEYLLYPIFPGISLHFLPQNVTRVPESTLAARLDEFQALCGADLYIELTELNRDDLTLFEAATKEVERRFLDRPLCHEWLAQFRARNSYLEYLQNRSLKARCREWVSRSRIFSPIFEWALGVFGPKRLSNGGRHFVAKTA